MSGADFSVKVNACIAAVIAAGGESVTRGLPGLQYDVGEHPCWGWDSPCHLLLPAGLINAAAGTQLVYNNGTIIRGAGGVGLLALGTAEAATPGQPSSAPRATRELLWSRQRLEVSRRFWELTSAIFT